MAKSLLIVDDEQSMRRLYCRIFSGEGYDFTLAGNLAEAKDLLLTRNYDLVITDLILGDGAGTELIALAAGAASGPDVILVSGAIEAWEAPLFIEKYKLKHCFIKPFATGALVLAVKRLLDPASGGASSSPTSSTTPAR